MFFSFDLIVLSTSELQWTCKNIYKKLVTELLAFIFLFFVTELFHILQILNNIFRPEIMCFATEKKTHMLPWNFVSRF